MTFRRWFVPLSGSWTPASVPLAAPAELHDPALDDWWTSIRAKQIRAFREPAALDWAPAARDVDGRPGGS